MRLGTPLFMLAAAGLLASCTGVSPPRQAATGAAPSQIGTCATTAASIDRDFDTGAFESCETQGEAAFELTIAPEDAPPINCSPWYAFRLSPRRAGPVSITLNYDACEHRYAPKISRDGGATWQAFPGAVATSQNAEGETARARFTVELGAEPVIVAGQEILDGANYGAWMNTLSASPAVTRFQVGQSREARIIGGMSVKAPGSTPSEQVVLIGRQHPPEVTGALAMRAFVETLTADTPLAKAYRARFETVVVPLVNPDGVANGNWRHNEGGVDLNRDWGPFTQPETQAMRDLLARIEDDPAKDIRLFMDFHSTWNDVFYTLPDETLTQPDFFIRDWLAALQARMPDYAVNRDPGHNPDSAVSKTYVYEAYQVPTVTFELGDRTPRPLIRRLGEESAIAMMTTLLETKKPDRQ
ncbi:M14 family metallopeptidase [Pacificimonas flava]|uniref:Peptidase M14 domain-containing protein n=1 Tax=Pacificimonas flava TaxID=1234595 RepID=M2U744_9SPHN|nr:M14 family metallopeptidase [Pacificimonas flava]EMD83827.1 hypothetical protein C725_0799 [Pacificimonas flava]MBB5280491.1 putative deacylase [Pacificimonas flava]